MEEILASIRQIIAEDGGSSAPKIDGVVAEPSRTMQAASEPAATREPTAPEPMSFAAPNVPSDDESPPAAPDFSSFARREDYLTEEPEPDRALRPLRAPVIAPRPWAEEEEAPLLSEESGQAISGAFGALANTLLAHGTPTRTLEDVVTEMLQPMLKQWLDDNLPAIVERKVKEEIERVSRGRR
jgi:cell pole-organizing protein PopZ